MAAQVEQAPPQGGGGIKAAATRKLGPLAVWQWALGLVLLVVVIYMWRKNAASASSTSSTSSTAGSSTTGAPGGIYDSQWQQAPYVWQRSGNGSGATVPPGSAGPPPDNTVPSTVPAAPPGAGAPPPTVAPPSQPSGGYVSVTHWPDNVNHESTLFDIAGKWYPGGSANWGQVWNDPMNADLRAKRGQPNEIQQGDQVWVPGKLSSPRD